MKRALFHAGAAVVGALALGVTVTSAAAQGPLTGDGVVSVSPVFKYWSFGKNLYQPKLVGTDSVQLQDAWQWSIPVAVTVPIGDSWTFDATSAETWGGVQLGGTDAALGTDHYILQGLTDVKLRVSGRLAGDHLVVTAGLNAATGKTNLNASELEALRVIGAPALGFPSQSLGSGVGGTGGLVAAQQFGDWSLAAGASYETRGNYSPVTAFTLGETSPDFHPGDAIHTSFGVSGPVGQSRTSLTLSGDFFRDDHLTYGDAGQRTVEVQLGPVYSADWQFLVGTTSLRELRFYAVDRYRGDYKQLGVRTSGTSGNYFDGGVRAVAGLTPTAGLSIDLDGQYQTGLSIDRSLTTAGVTGGGASVGLFQDVGNLIVRTFVRGQYSRLDMKTQKVTADAFTAGASLGVRF